jgi:hypothetical protein
MRCELCNARKSRCVCGTSSIWYRLAHLPEWQQWVITGVGYFLVIVLVILGTTK